MGCAAHWMTLLTQYIISISISKCIVEVQQYFRNHHKPVVSFKELSNTMKPQMPPETRLNSQIECISTFIKNRPAFLICETHESDFDIKIQTLVKDYNSFKQAKELFQQIHYVAKPLNNLQNDNVTIADAYIEELKLENCAELIPHEDQVIK